MAAVVVASPWPQRRARTTALGERWEFAADVLGFYAQLLDVQERAYASALAAAPADVAAYASEHVVPRVVEVSVQSGPPALSAGVLACFDAADFPALISRWLRSEPLDPVERFLSRAAAAPVIEAVGLPAPAETPDERHCPRCGGLPQLSTFASSTEDLVTAHRYLECSRCAESWAFPRLTCAACGETDTAKLLVYSEIGTAQAERSASIVKAAVKDVPSAQFPHVRIDGCASCRHYLLTIDLERDGRAVPVVDEIAAIPLDLYAKELGLRKIVPNLVGF